MKTTKRVLPLPLLLSLAALLALGSCRAQEPTFGFALPGELRLGELSADARARLFATIEIDGLLDERPLLIAPDLSEVTGVFELDGVTESRTASFTLRLWLAGADEAEGDVLLARAVGSATVEPEQDTALVPDGGDEPFDTCGGDAPLCEVALDLNRNGRPNLDDLVAGIDPTPPPPFVDIAPSTLQFPSGIRLGSFARQVIVVENTTASPIEATARIINAPGATLSRYDTDEGGTVRDRGKRSISLGEIAPFEERFLAVSFAPVNAFLTTGDVYLESRDPVSNVRQATRVKIIANADGELQPTRAGFDPAPLQAGANLGGYDAAVQVYPAAELWNGLPITGVTTEDAVTRGLAYTGRTMTATFGEEGESQIPADAAFLVEVEPEHQLSLSLSGLNTDVDLAAFWLDETDSITTDVANNQRSARSGLSPEALEIRNDSDATRRVLVVLGRVEASAPASAPGALTAEEEAQMSLASQQGNPPEITAIGPEIGPLEGGNRVLITGRGFQDGATVTFANAIALDCSYAKDDVTTLTTMDCTAPPGSLEIGKNPATIVVENPSQDEGGDGQAASLLEGYSFLPPAPQLDDLSPRVAPTAGSSGSITISGRFFSTRFGTPRVSFGAVDAATVLFVDGTRLDVLAPGQAAGVVSVNVYNRLEGLDDEGNPRWSLPSNVRNFTYIQSQGPAPTLTSLSPTMGAIDGGQQVTLTGSDFLLGAQVTFDGKASGSVIFAGPTSLTATLPTRTAPGVVDVEVVNPDGQSSRLEEAFTYFTPAPTVSGVFPPEASTTGGTFVVVNGSGFRAGVQALFLPTSGDALLSPNVNRVSADTMLVATPQVQGGGTYTLRVLNVDQQIADWAGTFRFLEPAGPAPVLESIDPGTGFNDTNNTVTVTGTDFRGDPLPTVLVGNETANVDSFIDCPSDPSCDAMSETDTVVFFTPVTTSEGPVVVRLINDDGQSDTSVYTYVKRLGQPPRIFEVNPPQGVGGDVITLTGFNFTVDAQSGDLMSGLLVRGSQLGTSQITDYSETHISFTMPEVPTDISLNIEVTVTNPDGQRSSANFLYVPAAGPAPFISQVSPGSGPVGTSLTVTGAYFDGIDQVFFGPVSVGSADYTLSATQLTLDVPATVPLGAAVIRLVDTDDGRTASATFNVTDPTPPAPPTIHSITPAEAPPAGGVTVTVAGAGFAPGAAVEVAGQTVAGATVTTTQASFSAPANAEGLVNVTVRNPDGQSAQVPFRYETPMTQSGQPQVGFVSPDRVHALIAGDEVTAVGQNLAGATGAFVQAQGGGQQTYAATIVGAPSDTSVRVRLMDPLPPSNDSAGQPYRVQLDFPGGPVATPFVDAMAPRVVSWSIEDDGSMLLFGEWFNPNHLVGVSLDDGMTQIAFSVDGASDGFIFARSAERLFPGGNYTLLLDYDVLGTGVSPFDSGQPAPFVNASPLRLDVGGTVLAGTDPSGTILGGWVDRLNEFSDDLGDPGAFTFTLEDGAGSAVASGTWERVDREAEAGMAGGESEDVDLTITSTTPLAAGGYRVVLSIARASHFAESDGGQVQAAGRRVTSVYNSSVDRGDGVLVDGIFVGGDLIVAAPDGDPSSTLQLGIVPNGFVGTGDAAGGLMGGGGSGVLMQTSPLTDGNWNLCAQAPGALVDCGPTDSATLTVFDTACGDAVTGVGHGGVVTVALNKDVSSQVACGTGANGAVVQVRPNAFGASRAWVRILDVSVTGSLVMTPGDDLCQGGTLYDQCEPAVDITAEGVYVDRLHLVFEDVGGDGNGTVTLQVSLGDEFGCYTPDGDGDGADPCYADCRDDNDMVGPGQTEVCDGQDNNCDGRVDVIGPCTVGGADGVCAQGEEVCQMGGGTQCVSARGPNTAEICGNGEDDICDMQTDEGDCTDAGVIAIPYAPDTLTSPVSLPLAGDDFVTGPHPIGFDFNYWGARVKDFWLSTNGTLSFSNQGPGCCGGEIPGIGGGLVAWAWSNLRSNRGSKAHYEVFGTAPNRRVVIEVLDFDYAFSLPGYERSSVSAQIKLFEGTGEIEVHYPRLWGTNNHSITQGFSDWVGHRGAIAHPSHVQGNFGGDGQAVRLLPLQSQPVCGDYFCDPSGGEDNASCPQDCDMEPMGNYPTSCGDGVCENSGMGQNELYDCPSDCGEGRCGNGVCEPGQNEDSMNCLADCGANVCGNGVCDAGEEFYCYQDCTMSDYDDDGDGLTTSVESGTTDPYNPDSDSDLLLDGLEASMSLDPNNPDSDVGGESDGSEVLAGRIALENPGDDLTGCGDQMCDDMSESPANCPADCWCGNGSCEAAYEDASSCPSDCGSGGGGPPAGGCNNGMCEPGEDPGVCPDDCSAGGCNNDAVCDAWEDQGGSCNDCGA